MLLPICMGILIFLFRKQNRKINKNILLVFGAYVVLLPYIIGLIYKRFLVGNNVFEKWIKVGFMSIVDFLNGKRSGYFSYFDEGDRFVIPKGVSLLFGVGKDTFTDGGIANVHTDVGFANYLWLGGLVYLFFVLFIFLLIAIDFIRSQNRLINYIGYLCVGITLVGNIKGIIFAVNEYTNFILILAVYYYVRSAVESGTIIDSIEKG